MTHFHKTSSGGKTPATNTEMAPLSNANHLARLVCKAKGCLRLIEWRSTGDLCLTCWRKEKRDKIILERKNPTGTHLRKETPQSTAQGARETLTEERVREANRRCASRSQAAKWLGCHPGAYSRACRRYGLQTVGKAKLCAK